MLVVPSPKSQVTNAPGLRAAAEGHRLTHQHLGGRGRQGSLGLLRHVQQEARRVGRGRGRPA